MGIWIVLFYGFINAWAHCPGLSPLSRPVEEVRGSNVLWNQGGGSIPLRGPFQIVRCVQSLHGKSQLLPVGSGEVLHTTLDGGTHGKMELFLHKPMRGDWVLPQEVKVSLRPSIMPRYHMAIGEIFDGNAQDNTLSQGLLSDAKLKLSAVLESTGLPANMVLVIGAYSKVSQPVKSRIQKTQTWSSLVKKWILEQYEVPNHRVLALSLPHTQNYPEEYFLNDLEGIWFYYAPAPSMHSNETFYSSF